MKRMNKTAVAWFAAITVTVCMAAATPAEVEDLNGDFTAGESLEEAGWSGWTRGDLGGFSFSSDARLGERSVHIEYPDVEPRYNEDWAFFSTRRQRVQPGEVWTASAWVKMENTGRVGIEIHGRTSDDERPGPWVSGLHAAYGTGDWQLLEATAVIPPEVHEIFVRLSGAAPTSAWIDGVRLRQGPASQEARPKPEVRGWNVSGERVAERLGRGVMAMPVAEGEVYIRWRLLPADAADVGFDVLRSTDGGEPVRLNDEPITATTDYIDRTADLSATNIYMVRPAGDESEPDAAARFTVPADAEIRPYLSIPLKSDDTTFLKAGIGDLNGDGRYDFVILTPGSSIDPWYRYWRPGQTTYKLQAYLSDGTFLWERDLGPNIEPGIWYAPFIVHDFSGDGRAEVALKSAPTDVDYTDAEPCEHGMYEPGRVRHGPEYVSLLDGMTGDELARADWPSREGLGSYNHYSRNQLGVAYLDGKTPCLLVARGTYGVMKLHAFHLRDGQLEKLWAWDSGEEPGGKYYGQGAHTMHVVDVDGDGRDEILLGACMINSNGVGRWSTNLGHPDNLWVGNIDPARPGLEVYMGIEGGRQKGNLRNGVSMWDASTGERLWGIEQRTHHVHGSGLVSNLDPRHVGYEAYSGEQSHPQRWLHTAQGELIADETSWFMGRLSPRAVYWDATLERELLVDGRIFKYPDPGLPDAVLLRGVEGRQTNWVDLFGDWREEVITSVPGELRIYTTTIPAEDRRVTLVADRLYRSVVAHQSMGYGQPPLTSYYIGREEPLREDE